VELTDRRRGNRAGVEPHHTSVRQPVPLCIIQYSLVQATYVACSFYKCKSAWFLPLPLTLPLHLYLPNGHVPGFILPLQYSEGGAKSYKREKAKSFLNHLVLSCPSYLKCSFCKCKSAWSLPPSPLSYLPPTPSSFTSITL
jgi:hypothetical protein